LALVLSPIGVPLARATDINGSGSTFVYPVMLRWAASYYAKTNVKVNYQAIGSGGGVHQVKTDLVTFAASDKPLAPAELQAAGLAQFPLVIGGVVPLINLQGVQPGQLNVTGELLADIYLGKITRWGAIQRLLC
jgi:phosphate transport system substrate-binding protein